MPFTNEFIKLKRRFCNQYSDKAKAEALAYEEARKKRIKTFREKKVNFKRQEAGIHFNYDF